MEGAAFFVADRSYCCWPGLHASSGYVSRCTWRWHAGCAGRYRELYRPSQARRGTTPSLPFFFPWGRGPSIDC